jgi:D-alanyl-D-alanine carboxypeptidase
MPLWKCFRIMPGGPESSIFNLPNIVRSRLFSPQIMWTEGSALNLVKALPALAKPVLFLPGRHDHVATSETSVACFERLTAPSKKLFWFEESEHGPPVEEPANFNAAMAQWVRPAASAILISGIHAIKKGLARSPAHSRLSIRFPPGSRAMPKEVATAASVPLVSSASPTAQPAVAISGAIPQARRYLDRMLADGDAPGLQYLFLSDDAVLYSYNGGMADLVNHEPVTDLTTFNAYSVAKTFTAAAILQLAEQGRVGLDRPIVQYLDAFPYDKSPTIRETLTHTGGFPNPNPMPWVHLADEHAAFDKAQFVGEVLRSHGRLKSEPGRAYAYSNVGYLLLGEVIEKASGQAYTEYVEHHLIRQLGLRDGETLAFDITRPQHHARGYLERWSLLNLALGFFIDRDRHIDARSGRWVQLRNLYVNGAAYGGLIGNARGFARYLQALLGRDDYLSPAIRALLLTPAHGPRGRDLSRSVGWFFGNLGGEHYYAHAGGAAGYYCEVRIYPRIGRASVVMFNRTGIRDERILDRIDGYFVTGSGETGNAIPDPAPR